MEITELEVYTLRAPDNERPHWVSHFLVPRANELLMRISTDEGIDGFGLASNYTSTDSLTKAFHIGIREFIIGQDPLAPERLYSYLG